MKMVKKAVDESLAAYKSKGMKAPRPEAGPELDPSSPPAHKPKHQMKAVPYEGGKVKPEDAKNPPTTKKKGLPHVEAPKQVSDVNGGQGHMLPKGGMPGDSEV